MTGPAHHGPVITASKWEWMEGELDMQKVQQLFVGLVVGIVAVALLPITATAGNSQFFPETNQTSQNAFYDFWLAHGQLPILGLPLSPAYRMNNQLVVQVYERAVMEWHPENTQENRVQLQRLGDSSLNQLQNGQTGEKTGDKARATPPRPCTPDQDCETFAATNHTVVGVFRDYWLANGGLATFGYPLTEEQRVCQDRAATMCYTSQYFERNQFEYHPEINGGTILLRRLGALVYDGSKNQITKETIVTVPDYTSNVPFLPATP
jgi:hypothetical protein